MMPIMKLSANGMSAKTMRTGPSETWLPLLFARRISPTRSPLAR
jgi:hypothetical protein